MSLENIKPIVNQIYSQSDKQDLKGAIFYLPRSFNPETIYKALKEVFKDEGLSIAKEWLNGVKRPIPPNFQGIWQNISLTSYEKHTFSQWLSDNIYDEAEKYGWMPDALLNGKPISSDNEAEHIDNENTARMDAKELFRKLLELQEKVSRDPSLTRISRAIINYDGACYKHPSMSKKELMEKKDVFIDEFTLLVDCEVRIIEASEVVIEKYGREPDEIQVHYTIELNNKKDKRITAKVTHEELTTKTRFSSFLVSKGFIKFQGEGKDFNDFHKFILKYQSYPTVRIPANWGELTPGVFLFENGIFCTHSNNFFPADDDFRISYQGKKFICPIGSEQVKPPQLRTQNHSSRDFLVEIFELWQSFNGSLNVRTTIGYAVASVFSRDIMAQLKGFPMLFKFGMHATGKSTSMDWFMAIFGYRGGNRQSVSKQNTLKGISRRMTLPRSFPFFLDDYRNVEGNSNVPDLTSSFLNWYQRIGTGMAKKSTDQSTVDTHMNACVVMTGNDKPNDPAALSRLLILNYNNHMKGSRVQDIHKISENEDRLSEFLFLILQDYKLIKKAFFDHLKKYKDRLIKKNFDGRTVNNWAIILAGVECMGLLLPELEWHEQMDELELEIIASIRKEQELERSQNVLIEFLETLNYYAAEKKNQHARLDEEWYALDRRHFTVKQYTPSEDSKIEYHGPALAIHMSSIWNVLKDYKADITRKASRSTIESKLQNSEIFLERSVNVFMHKDQKSQNKKTKRCFMLNLELLNKQGVIDDLVNQAAKNNLY
jgi:hypothetical protein